MSSMEELNTLDTRATKEAWGIDRKIPVAIIGVVIFQTMAITWGAATLSTDVKNYGEKIVKLENNFDKFVEKTESRFETRTSHDLDKLNAFGEIDDIKKDIQTLETRLHELEVNLK